MFKRLVLVIMFILWMDPKLNVHIVVALIIKFEYELSLDRRQNQYSTTRGIFVIHKITAGLIKIIRNYYQFRCQEDFKIDFE